MKWWMINRVSRGGRRGARSFAGGFFSTLVQIAAVLVLLIMAAKGCR